MKLQHKLSDQIFIYAIAFLPFPILGLLIIFGFNFVTYFSWMLTFIGLQLIALLVLVCRLSRRSLALRDVVIDHRGAVCTKCHYPLPASEQGVCPECGTAYTRESNREFWNLAP